MYTKISIITPSFNQGEFIEETILSVLNQNYDNIEYIIIDGGSSDNTINIIKKYEHKIKYWISENDDGQTDAINKGFERSSGDILCWLNSDDVYLPGTIQNIVNYFNTNPTIDVVYGDLEIIDKSGLVLGIKKVIPYSFRSQLFTASLIPQPSSFWRASVTNRIGILNENYHYQMDYEYFVRMGAYNLNFGIIKKSLTQFRLHVGSKTITEYKKLFFIDQIEIQSRYIHTFLQNKRILIILKYLYKLKVFIFRAIYRGDIIPFRHIYRMRTQKN
jgi:glycosyltransferase involved in cell wall biosynthesis